MTSQRVYYTTPESLNSRFIWSEIYQINSEIIQELLCGVIPVMKPHARVSVSCAIQIDGWLMPDWY